VILATDLKRETLESLRERFRGASMTLVSAADCRWILQSILPRPRMRHSRGAYNLVEQCRFTANGMGRFEGSARIPERGRPEFRAS